MVVMEFGVIELSFYGPACSGSGCEVEIADYWADMQVLWGSIVLHLTQVRPLLASRVALDISVPLMNSLTVERGLSCNLTMEITELTFGWTSTFWGE